MNIIDGGSYWRVKTSVYQADIYKASGPSLVRLYTLAGATINDIELILRSGTTSYWVSADPAKTVSISKKSSSADTNVKTVLGRVDVSISCRFYHPTPGYLCNDYITYKLYFYEDRIVHDFLWPIVNNVTISAGTGEPYPFNFSFAPDLVFTSTSGVESAAAATIETAEYVTFIEPADASTYVQLLSVVSIQGSTSGNISTKYNASAPATFGWLPNAVDSLLLAGNTYRIVAVHIIDVTGRPEGSPIYNTAEKRQDIAAEHRDYTSTISQGSVSSVPTGMIAIGSGGLCSDGSWHITSEENGESSILWSRVRTYPSVYVDIPTIPALIPRVSIDGATKTKDTMISTGHDIVVDGDGVSSMIVSIPSIAANKTVSLDAIDSLICGDESSSSATHTITNSLINSALVDSNSDGVPDNWSSPLTTGRSEIKRGLAYSECIGWFQRYYEQPVSLIDGHTYLAAAYLHSVSALSDMLQSAFVRVTGVTKTFGQTFCKRGGIPTAGWYGCVFKVGSSSSPKFKFGIGIDRTVAATAVLSSPILVDVTDIDHQHPLYVEYVRTIATQESRHFLWDHDIPSPRYLSVWGDSLVEGNGRLWQDLDHTIFAYQLAIESGFPAYHNGGYGGQGSTYIKDQMLLYPERHSDVTIIWVGRNNYTSPSVVKADIAEMVSSLDTDRYLVMTVLNGNYITERANDVDHSKYDTIIALNSDLISTYGDRCFDVRSYLAGLAAPGAAYENSAAYAADIVPLALREDDIHLNDIGNRVVADAIKAIFSGKGWSTNPIARYRLALQYPGPLKKSLREVSPGVFEWPQSPELLSVIGTNNACFGADGTPVQFETEMLALAALASLADDINLFGGTNGAALYSVDMSEKKKAIKRYVGD